MEERYDIDIKALGTRIRDLRKNRKLSQLDSESITGIDRTEVSKIENGLRNVEFYTIVKLASALDVEINQLFSK